MLTIFNDFYRKMKRKQKIAAKQASPVRVVEDDELNQSSSLSLSTPVTATPSLPATTDEKAEEGAEEQEDKEEVVDHVNSRQNGTEVSDHSDSETDSSGSSAED